MKLSKTLPVILSMAITLMVGITLNDAQAKQAHVETTIAAISTKETVPVTWKNFVRAETDKMFKSYVVMGGFGKFLHIAKPTPIDQQKVVRMNRDTIYSFGIFDLTTPVTIDRNPLCVCGR